jgi:(p)ppGpp synthase/HD superfamily hydrolase
MGYSTRVTKAFELAATLHRDQERKGEGVPYLTHLMAVAALVGEYGGDEDQVIAALLHDAAEDQGGDETLGRIRETFGAPVAEYVAACSDTTASPKPPWRARKEAFLARLTAMPAEARLIVAADKVHNALTIVRSLRRHGEAVWDRFKGGKEGTLWYYSEVVRGLSEGWEHPILNEVSYAVDRLHRTAFTTD